MDPLQTYDYLTLARQRVLAWVRELPSGRYTSRIPPWGRTIAQTLTHIMISEWYYVQRIEGRVVPPYAEWPIHDEEPPPLDTLVSAWTEQAGATRSALGAVPDWAAPLEYEVTDDEGRRNLVTTSAGGLFTQLAFHEVHHRSQVLGMLRALGVAIEDLDFNALTFERRVISE